MTETPLPENDISSGDEFLSDSDFESMTVPSLEGRIVEADPEERKRPAARSALRVVADEKASPREATSKPPSIDEWSKFFRNVVVRTATDWYLEFAFRGVDEDTVSEQEYQKLALTDDERKTIAVPFAELSSKSKLMRSHGRTIVASGDAINSLVVLASWMRRVNRIAGKHRKSAPKTQVAMNGSNGNGHSGQGAPESASAPQTGTSGGHFPEWWSGQVIPGSG